MIIFSVRPNNGCLVSISGPIYDWDATDLNACLAQAGGGPVEIWVNSNGGDLQAGFAMRNLIAMYAGPVQIHAIGPVHSAASVSICVKNAKVIAHKGAAFMIHRCAALTDGNSDELRKAADVLDKLDDSLVAVYAERLKADDKEIRRMLAEETWLDVDEALRLGLVDEKYEEDPDVPMMEPPAVREDDPEDLIQRAVAECSTRFVDELKARFAASASDAGRPMADAVVSACQRFEAVNEQTDEKFKALSDRLDELAKRCEDLAAKNSDLSAALSRAYALDDGGSLVSCSVETPKFKLNF